MNSQKYFRRVNFHCATLILNAINLIKDQKHYCVICVAYKKLTRHATVTNWKIFTTSRWKIISNNLYNQENLHSLGDKLKTEEETRFLECVIWLNYVLSLHFIFFICAVQSGKSIWQYFKAGNSCWWETTHLIEISHFVSNQEFTQELSIFHVIILARKNALAQTFQSNSWKLAIKSRANCWEFGNYLHWSFKYW